MQRTSPTEKDRQIQSSLGDFQCLKQLIERDTTHGSRLVGVSSSQIRSHSSFPSQPLTTQTSQHKLHQTVQLQSQIQPPSQIRIPTKQVYILLYITLGFHFLYKISNTLDFIVRPRLM